MTDLQTRDVVTLLMGTYSRYRRGEMDSGTAYQEARSLYALLRDFSKKKGRETPRTEDLIVSFIGSDGNINTTRKAREENAQAPIGPAPRLSIEEGNRLLVDALSRQRRGLIDAKKASREAYILRAILYGLRLLKEVEGDNEPETIFSCLMEEYRKTRDNAHD